MKPIIEYSGADFGIWDNPVGHRVFVVLSGDYPGFGLDSPVALTSEVVNYDETLGHIETANTLYVPQGSLTEGGDV